LDNSLTRNATDDPQQIIADLQHRLDESIAQQTATADVLKVISRSAFDLQTVLDTLTASAARLCNADMASISRQDDAGFYHVTNYNFPPDWVDYNKSIRMRPGRGSIVGRALLEAKVVQVADVLADPEYTYIEPQRKSGYRTFLAVPLIGEGNPIGVLALCRKTVQPFTDNQIELVETFADQAVIAIGNVRLFNETQDALERQTATAEILKVIAGSPSDTTPVFEAIASSAKRLLGGFSTAVFRVLDGTVHLAAFTPVSPAADAALQADFPQPVENFIAFQLAQHGEPIAIADTEEVSHAPVREIARLHGFRGMLWVPMVNGGLTIGIISVTRAKPGAFAVNHIQLLQTFADQAVIAIENARLFNQVQAKTASLTESLQQQTATAEVLKVISRSAFDLKTVLQTLVESAARLCEADLANIWRPKGTAFRLAVSFGVSGKDNERLENAEYLESIGLEPGRGSIVGRVLLEKRTVQVEDVQVDPEYQLSEVIRIGAYRTVLGVPLLREGIPIGVIFLTRCTVQPFTEKQIELVTTFADQAVIAIENVRLFDEVQERTRELSESLEYQTATGDVLNVISRSPSNIQPVLDTIVETAGRLCDSYDTIIFLREGHALRVVAHRGPILLDFDELPIGHGAVSGRAVLERQSVHVHDVTKSQEFPDGQAMGSRLGYRTILATPLLKENVAIGAIIVRRAEVRPFADKQITLLQTFADQAVIAIENVRLFDEVQAKTRDLTESLQQQTATADVLKVISRSAFDLQPVLDTIVQTASHLCDAEYAFIYKLQDDGKYHMAANNGADQAFLKYAIEHPLAPGRGSLVGRTALERKTVHMPDCLADPEYVALEYQSVGHYRSNLGVPLLREGVPIGVIILMRAIVMPFTDKQIELVTTFADQAVIAISNVALFEQVQQRTQELSRSLDDLRTAQDRLVQTEKLASLGQLTAGIAHEIKNPLNFVNNFSALSAELTDELKDLLKSAALSEKMREEVSELTGLLKDNLEKVVQHGKRADSIVKNMLLHSREGSGEHRPADINSLLEESLNLAYHGARAEKGEFNITLQRDFDAEAGIIELFPQEITRAFLNLISNGVYAVMKRKMDDKEPDFEPTLRATTKNLGTTVEIRIRDNGIGILAAVREKMFNPFFTTKPAGEGTGLGLSMSHDIIVKQHGGRIDVETEPGQFTEFIIVLPRTSNHSGKRG
jgi:GAF domain-containing protein